MKSKRLSHSGGTQTFVLVFDSGDDATKGLLEFATANAIDAASFTGIGAFESVTLGYFDVQKHEYTRIEIAEQVEVVSLVGNIARGDNGPKLHAHVVVSKSDGTAHGGHLMEGRVRPTLEIVLVETPAHLKRRSDAATGLLLIDLDR
jgi:uncharacterized protein